MRLPMWPGTPAASVLTFFSSHLVSEMNASANIPDAGVTFAPSSVAWSNNSGGPMSS